MKLYELTEQYKQLEELADSGDFTDEQLADTFEALEGEYQSKVVACVSVIKNFDSDVEAIDKELKRLQDLKRTAKNNQERLREYLKFNMLNSGIEKIDCPLFKVTITKPRKVLHIDDESLIPDEFIKVTKSPMKTEIKKALESGDVDGCYMAYSEPGLMIR